MGNQQAQTDPSKPTQGIDSLSEIANATGTDRTKINKGFSNVIQNYKKKENTITKKYKITRKQIIDSFNKYAINNDYLNKPLFNDAICSLFSFPLRKSISNLITSLSSLSLISLSLQL